MKRPPQNLDEMTFDELRDEHRDKCRKLRRHYAKIKNAPVRSKQESDRLLNLMGNLYGKD